MGFREYKIGTRMIGFALGTSMCITLIFPSFDIAASVSSEVGLDKQLTGGWGSGFMKDDPYMKGWDKPTKVLIRKDPKTGEAIEPQYVYVYQPGTLLPNGVTHTNNLGQHVEGLSIEKGKINEAKRESGTVFMINFTDEFKDFKGDPMAYIVNATATKGWTPDAVMKSAADGDISYASQGKSIWTREGCWWCHTLLPEQTQDWQAFGSPPMLGDFNGESPTAFGSDRKGPDLLHVGSRNSSREWMTLHFFNPRLVQPHSIMPRFDYLWGKVDANGQPIDFEKWRAEYVEYREGKRVLAPEVPLPAKNSEARMVIDFVLNLK